MKIKDLSFFKDTIYISPQIQKKSLSFQVLSYLELWLSTGPSCCPNNKYELQSNSPNCTTLSIFSAQKKIKNPYVLSTSKKIAFYCLKILSTILIFPRLIAELIRFNLRKGIENLLDFPIVKINHKIYNSEAINSQIATIYSQLLEQSPVNGVIYPKSSNILYQSDIPLIIPFELTQYPELTFKIGRTPPLSNKKSLLSQEIDNMRIVEKCLKKQKTLQHFYLPLAYIYNEDQEDWEEFPCFIIEHKSNELNSNTLQAFNLWKNNEIKAIPVFVAFARFLYTSGYPYTNPSEHILNISKDTITMTIKADKDFHNLNDDFTKNQIYFLFQDLHTEACMDAIIQKIVMEENETKGQSAGLVVKNELEKIKQDRLQMIESEQL
ncbi:hypothetical protein CLAVI_000394 [Candidatus Clavichlamydia salmonicola]|uniref:hypothetical protein n=1 Tax=Candidatus Clavichlamydia salmonicola TaxID=469812 RepID=UPI001891C835|nr:hypothetical protein [Candidatus Clavichlamydia salmonicola]MBF5050775.1 hypothetical protein [Candidatus Clavichlamydia salmonicola]